MSGTEVHWWTVAQCGMWPARVTGLTGPGGGGSWVISHPGRTLLCRLSRLSSSYACILTETCTITPTSTDTYSCRQAWTHPDSPFQIQDPVFPVSNSVHKQEREWGAKGLIFDGQDTVTAQRKHSKVDGEKEKLSGFLDKIIFSFRSFKPPAVSARIFALCCLSKLSASA